MSIQLRKYIGRPYKKFNCFALAKEFYADQFKIDLSQYYEGDLAPDRHTVESLIISNKGDFIQVEEPMFGDIVVIKLRGLECHIGVCVGNGNFIHSTIGVGSNMEKLEKYSRLIAGYYRHVGKND